MKRAIQFPPLEKGFPIPDPSPPRKNVRRPVWSNPAVEYFLANVQHGDSVRVPLSRLNAIKYVARKAGWQCRWKKDGSIRMMPGGYDLQAIRIWFLKVGEEGSSGRTENE